MVIYPHVVTTTVDGSVSTEEAGVQVGLSLAAKQLVRDLLRVKVMLEIEELTEK